MTSSPADKEQHQEELHFTPEHLGVPHGKKYIDVDLKLLGWTIGDDVREEVELYGMPNNEGKGYADCLEQMTGTRPMMFTTNGFETNLQRKLVEMVTQIKENAIKIIWWGLIV